MWDRPSIIPTIHLIVKDKERQIYQSLIFRVTPKKELLFVGGKYVGKLAVIRT